jgi:hypothetical protein
MHATAELELAPIEAKPKTDLQPLDLRKIDLTDVALAQYGDWRKDVAATKANLSTLVLDLSTQTKIKEARTLRHRLIGEPLATVRKVAAGIKSKMAATSKAVGAELEQIEAAYTEADALILPKIEAREAELEAERLEKARIEAARVEALQAGVARLLSYSDRAIGQPAEKIAQAIAALEVMHFHEDKWQEFTAKAAAARDDTLAKLRVLHGQALEAERLRAENERMRAEAAAREAAAAMERAASPPVAPVSTQPETTTTPGGMVVEVATGEIVQPLKQPGQRMLETHTDYEARVARDAAEAAPAPAPTVHVDTSADTPAVKLGDLCARLGFTMTEAFVRDTMKIQPVPSKGRAVLIPEAALPDLRDSLIARIREVLG